MGGRIVGVEGAVVFENSMGLMQQFAHHGPDDRHLGFTGRQQALCKDPQQGIGA